MIKSESIGKLVEALAKAQNEFSPILKTSENPGFKKEVDGVKISSKYADLAATIEATQPSLIKNGLVVTQFPINTDARVGVLSILAHISGEYIGQEFTLPIFKQDAQTGVAGITYARRSSYQGIIGAAAEDDDGNSATGRKIDDPVHDPAKYTVPTGGDDILPKKIGGQKLVFTYATKEPTEFQASFAVPASVGSPLPDDAQYESYLARLKNMREKLQNEGKLKPSAGLPAARKMLNYIKKVTGQEDLKQVTVVQFDSFFQFAEKMDPEGLVKLINDVDTNKGGK